MKAAYIVIEGKSNAELLKQVLPTSLLPETEIVGMPDWYSAFSLAGTIMSERSRPVLLIVDANSDSPLHAREREQTLTGLLLPAAAAAPYKVCVAVPTVAALAQNWPDRLTTEQVQELQHHPLIQQITQFLAATLSLAT
jgi:hypothetical protein